MPDSTCHSGVIHLAFHHPGAVHVFSTTCYLIPVTYPMHPPPILPFPVRRRMMAKRRKRWSGRGHNAAAGTVSPLIRFAFAIYRQAEERHRTVASSFAKRYRPPPHPPVAKAIVSPRAKAERSNAVTEHHRSPRLPRSISPEVRGEAIVASGSDISPLAFGGGRRTSGRARSGVRRLNIGRPSLTPISADSAGITVQRRIPLPPDSPPAIKRLAIRGIVTGLPFTVITIHRHAVTVHHHRSSRAAAGYRSRRSDFGGWLEGIDHHRLHEGGSSQKRYHVQKKWLPFKGSDHTTEGSGSRSGVTS